MTEEQESERRQAEFKARSQRFVDALDVDDVIAHLLVTEGFTSVEEVAYVPEEDIISIEGFDEGLAQELRARASAYLEAESDRLSKRRIELGVEDALEELSGISAAMLITLGEAGIKTLNDFADLASDELVEENEGYLRDFNLTNDDANELIMGARVAAGWFTAEELATAREVAEATRLAEAEAAKEVQNTMEDR